MRRRSLLQLTALLPLAAQAQAPIVVRIGWLRGPNAITLGRACGTIEKALAAHGATVQWAGPFAAAAPALEALNAGAIDVTAGSSTASITGLAAGVALVVFAYQKISAAGEGILVKQDGPMKTLADLKGHTVAVNRGGTGEYLLMRGLAHNNIDPATVKRIYLGLRMPALPSTEAMLMPGQLGIPSLPSQCRTMARGCWQTARRSGRTTR